MEKSALLLSVIFLIIIFTASFQSANFSFLPQYLAGLVSTAVFILFFYIASKKPIAGGRVITFLFLAGLLLRIVYLSDTPYFVRGHDVQGHIDYIKYAADNYSLPSADDCWQCYHPPLYYLLLSPVCVFSSCADNSVIILQLISILFNFGFLYFGIKLLRLYLPDKTQEKYFNLAAAILIFWPSGIIDSVRVGNDALLYFLMAGGMYFITRWFVGGKSKDIWLALSFSILSMFTKSNGAILLGIIVFTILLRFVLAKNKKEVFFTGVKIFLLLVFISVMFFLRPALNSERQDYKDVLVGNVSGLASGLSVSNKISNYAFFDAKEFLAVPYADPWSDAGGRQYFLNYLFKTSLFGEFSFWQDVLKKQAVFLSFALLLLMLIVVLGIVFAFLYRESFQVNSSIMLVAPKIALFVLAIALFRWAFPFASSGNFRYIFPVIIPVSGIAAYVPYCLSSFALKSSASKLSSFFLYFSLIAEGIAYIFIISSILFYVSMVIL